MGGNLGGDALVAPKGVKSVMQFSNGASLIISSSDSSGEATDPDEVGTVVHPVHQVKRIKRSPLLMEGGKPVDDEKEAKKEARNAFWATKGRVSKDGEGDVYEE